MDDLETDNLTTEQVDPLKKPLKNESDSLTSSMDVPFTPYDHTTVQIPKDDVLEAFGSNPVQVPPETPGYFEGSLAYLKDSHTTYQIAHGAWAAGEDYMEGYKDPNFNPLQHLDKFLNVRLEYQPYLLAAENERQMNFRLERIQREQSIDDSVKNGTWMQWLTGKGLSLIDPINLIPIIGEMKYSSVGKTALNTVIRNAPGGIAYGLSVAAGKNLEKINGNMQDFMVDSFVNSIFATALFAGPAVGAIVADKLALWEMKSVVADRINGIGYKLKVGEEGKVEGFQAYDMTGNEAMNAMKVKLAQDKADTVFAKSGFFKIPYVGTATEKLMSNPAFGSLALSMLTSPFQTASLVIDRAYEHGIITKSLEKGEAQPIKFFTLLKQSLQEIRQEQNIFNALLMQRNGIDSKNYIAQNLRRGGLYARQKTLEMIQGELGDKVYISPEEFMQEIEQVMHSGESAENGAINEAAAMFKKSMDNYYRDFRLAHGLSEDWMPPRTANQYLMRVYDTSYMNGKFDVWQDVISNELKRQDDLILKHTAPIRDVEAKIENNIAKQEEYIADVNTPDAKKEFVARELMALKAQKKALEEDLQNQIRENPDLAILADDWNGFSAKEAEELKALTKRRDIAAKEIEIQKKKIAAVKEQAKKREQAALKNRTTKGAQANKRKSEIGLESIKKEEEHLAKLELELEEEEKKLQEMAYAGKINKRFIYKKADEANWHFRNPDERIKFRKTYHEEPGGIRLSESEAHDARIEHAKAYYDTIMNQTAEDTINQVMAKFTGNAAENHIKERTMMIPDQVLYDNKFMSKDLLAKVANYKVWLARRTHLKTAYSQASLEGGFKPIAKMLHDEFDAKREALYSAKAKVEEMLAQKDLPADKKKAIEKDLAKVEKAIKKNSAAFKKAKNQITHVYEKMMGMSKLGSTAKSVVSGVRSFNAFASLGFLPATMITDLTGNGLKQGLVPFIQSGLYPYIQSLGGLLATHDSASLRGTAGALNLALHHIGNSSAARQLDLATNPYLNLGKIPEALDKISHFASNISFTTSIDNQLQRITSAVAQSNVIMHMMAWEKGTLTKADRMWLNRYGLDPEKDGPAILKAFRQDGGGTNKLGGYMSNFWHWKDLESANKVSNAVFRSTEDTIISANALDSPMWLDENQLLNVMGPIIKGFKGWAFASLNRYLIPTMQAPDAQKLMGFALMTASAALVSPSRRMAKGESPYREGQTATQIAAEILMDSPQFAWLSEGLNDLNLISGNYLLGELRNDKNYNRTLVGILGPTGSNLNKLHGFVTALATGNMNQYDADRMASMIPVANSLYGFKASQFLIENSGLPKRRPQ